MTNAASEALPESQLKIHGHEEPIKLFETGVYSRILPEGDFQLEISSPGSQLKIFQTRLSTW